MPLVETQAAATVHGELATGADGCNVAIVKCICRFISVCIEEAEYIVGKKGHTGISRAQKNSNFLQLMVLIFIALLPYMPLV